jgi:hypothetical protein
VPLFYFEGIVDGWGRIKDGAKYSAVKERTFRDWLKAGLKHSRLPSGTILIRYSWIDEFLEKYEVNENQVDKIVDETMKGL